MSKQFSLKRADHWECSLWLTFDSEGGVRSTRGQPVLGRNERAMSLTIKVPFALFSTPTLRATMTIEAPEPVAPPIDLTAAAEALKGALGFDFDVRMNVSDLSQ